MIKLQVLAFFFVIATTQSLADSEALKATVKSETTFASKFSYYVYKHKQNFNAVCSPLSSYLVLSELAYGASGETATQLHNALSLPTDIIVSLNGIQTLQTELKAVKNLTAKIANKIITYNGLELNDKYINYVNNVFGPQIEPFYGRAKDSVDYVNTWIDSQTNHTIQELITKDDVDDTTAMLLLNAVYFNAAWQYPFNPKYTMKKNFTDLEQKEHSLDMMLNIDLFVQQGVLKDFPANVVELPYKNSDFKLVLIVPDDETINAKEFAKLGDLLRQKHYKDLMKYNYLTQITLLLPKFKIESTIDLEPVLKDMGVTDIFTAGANFSHLLKYKNMKIQVSKVIQKVFIDVNEIGSVAGAATGSTAILKSGVKLIRVTKPFYFSIESPFGTLFQGRVLLPKY